MTGNKEGSTKITIPKQSYESCSGCKFLTHRLVRSGRDPVYRNDCTHPDNGQIKGGLSFTGNLAENHAGIIETPEWCPYKKKPLSVTFDFGKPFVAGKMVPCDDPDCPTCHPKKQSNG